MKLVRCHKCGAVIMGENDFLQEIIDKIEQANRRAEHGKTRAARNAAVIEAAEYRAMYKAYMHNLTSAQYAEQVTPIILQEVRSFCLANGRLTLDEWNELSAKGRSRAKEEQAIAERKADHVFGSGQIRLDSLHKDPTFDEAMRNIARDSRSGKKDCHNNPRGSPNNPRNQQSNSTKPKENQSNRRR